jgi:hypothetical protein
MTIVNCKDCHNENCRECGNYMRSTCWAFKEAPKLTTNYDRIRAKSVEELAEIMVGDCPPNYPHGDCREYEKNDGNLDCSKCWLD